MPVATHSDVLARVGHALSDATRARILLILRDAPAFPTDLVELLGTSKQSVSNHLACLRGCGLVVATPQGRRMRYELSDPALGVALDAMLHLELIGPDASCEPDARGECR